MTRATLHSIRHNQPTEEVDSIFIRVIQQAQSTEVDSIFIRVIQQAQSTEGGRLQWSLTSRRLYILKIDTGHIVM